MKTPTLLAKKALELGWNKSFPVSSQEIATNITVRRTRVSGERVDIPIVVFSRDHGPENPSWARSSFLLINKEPVFVCEYNSYVNPLLKSFIIARHLNYIMSGVLVDIGLVIEEYDFDFDTIDLIHLSANRFAFNLLMPEFFVRHYYGSLPPLKKIASVFNVSESIMLKRLKQLGLA